MYTRIGCPASRVVFDSPCKTEAEIAEAIGKYVYIYLYMYIYYIDIDIIPTTQLPPIS